MRRAVDAAVSWALPPRCPACGVVVDGDHRLCAPCWQMVDFLDGPSCLYCSMPFVQHIVPEPAACGACLADPPPFIGAPAATAYGDISRRLALRLKHGRKLGDAKLMALFMARKVQQLQQRYLQDMAQEAEIILLPVPLHRWRLWARGYNQSALLARHMAAILDASHDPHLLIRTKSTPSLQGHGKRERQQIMRGAITLRPEGKAKLRGKYVILVDDVHTSGATLRACGVALRRSGAACVSAVTWARVVPSAIMTANLFDFGALDSDMG